MKKLFVFMCSCLLMLGMTGISLAGDYDTSSDKSDGVKKKYGQEKNEPVMEKEMAGEEGELQKQRSHGVKQDVTGMEQKQTGEEGELQQEREYEATGDEGALGMEKEMAGEEGELKQEREYGATGQEGVTEKDKEMSGEEKRFFKEDEDPYTLKEDEGFLDEERSGQEEGMLEEDRAGQEEGMLEKERAGKQEGTYREEGAVREQSYSDLYGKADADRDDRINRSEFNDMFNEYDEVSEEQFDWYDLDGDGEWNEDEWNAFTDDADQKEFWEW